MNERGGSGGICAVHAVLCVWSFSHWLRHDGPVTLSHPGAPALARILARHPFLLLFALLEHSRLTIWIERKLWCATPDENSNISIRNSQRQNELSAEIFARRRGIDQEEDFTHVWKP